MKATTKKVPSLTEDLVITREFNVPRESLWEAWTNPKVFMKWWGPKDFTCPHCEIDLRPGGEYHNAMRSREGMNYWTTGVYKEVVPFEKIVFTDSFADDLGHVVPASYYGMSETFPLALLITVSFEEIDGRTKMTLRHSGLPPGEVQDMSWTGWNESFDKLAEIL